MLHVAGLWIAMDETEDGVVAIVMRVALDRAARGDFGVVLLEPWVESFEVRLGHCEV